MSQKNPQNNFSRRRILSRAAPEEFIGRADELERIVRFAARDQAARGLLLLLAPTAGVSELLRQAYDQLFNMQGEIVPVYFALTRNDRTAVGAARQFLRAFISQLVAFRRNDPAIAGMALSNSDLMELVSPSDYEWVERLMESSEQERARDNDERALIRLCLSAPQRAAANGTRVFVMLDGVQLAEALAGEVSLGAEIIEAFRKSNEAFLLAGLRRRILDLVHGASDDFDGFDVIRLERLTDGDARALVEALARRAQVAVNDQTRDLIVQQFSGSPFFINALVQSAREKSVSLTNYLHCQQLYVDDLMSGRIKYHFASLLEEIAPAPTTRRALIKALYETAHSDGGKSPVEVLKKRLGLESTELERLMHALHVHELASINTGFVETTDSYPVWEDYLRISYRLEVAGEPLALVAAETLIDALKRAPRTMERHYRRVAALGLGELLSGFNCQRVPANLFHYDRFSRAYKGTDASEISAGLDTETELVRLPQVVYAASCAAFHTPVKFTGDEERCVVAHGFDAGSYTEASEVTWLAAEVESKLEAGRGITEIWCDRLAALARANRFGRVRLWLIASEGFSAEASELLAEREAYGSSHQQLELLTARIKSESAAAVVSSANAESGRDEFELVIPMGDDTELIAAHTVDQIARRIAFQPEAINQIKTALVEACINATEHSLSPDRKIYQRFRLESDRLVVTVSSRGVVPLNVVAPNGDRPPQSNQDQRENGQSKDRRGWGLKLIRSLMDEVEFERVDDGTRLRMTKFLRK